MFDVYYDEITRMTDEDIRNLLSKTLDEIRPTNKLWLEAAKSRTTALAIPPRALGRLHEFSEQLCAVRETLTPRTENRAVVVMAGDHGVAAQGVSAFPQEVTGEMVRNFLAGGASVNALAREAGARVWVVDAGIIPDLGDSRPTEQGGFLALKVARGTADMSNGPAMTLSQARRSVAVGCLVGARIIDGGADVIATGDMGIANTTSSTAVAMALTGRSPDGLVGRGTGLDREGLDRKAEVLHRILECNKPDPKDGWDVLSKVGGLEIGGIAGLVLAGAHRRRPVIIDGLISTAGALVAQALCPSVTDYLFAGHCSQEPAHRIMLEHLGLSPILDLGMRLGEGTGAVLAMGILGAASRLMSEVLTFQEAEVTRGEAVV